MAVKRDEHDQVALPDVAVLTGARWFAGKGRRIADVARVGGILPEGAEGASIAFLEVVYDDGDRERYALALRGGRECAGDDLLWTAVAHEAGVEVAPGTSRFLAEDLSNTVVSLDDRLVLKLYRRLERGPHPEAELLAALRGLPLVPALEGVLEHDGTTVALVEELVVGEPVGWEGLITRLAAREEALEDTAALGSVAATLHRRLAEVLPGRVGTAADVEGERATVVPAASETEQPLAVRERLEALERLAGALLQRVHGDLHVGQVLQARRGLVVIDFEGDPSLALAERSRERSPLVDLASLLLSLDHAACAAARREPALDWRAWSARARSACLSAYEAESGAVDRELLRALEIAKELRELVYASRWLPEWLYAPKAVLPTLLEDVP